MVLWYYRVTEKFNNHSDSLNIVRYSLSTKLPLTNLNTVELYYLLINVKPNLYKVLLHKTI